MAEDEEGGRPWLPLGVERGMPAASQSLAARFDPAPHPDFWDRPAAWASLDLAKPPTLPRVG